MLIKQLFHVASKRSYYLDNPPLRMILIWIHSRDTENYVSNDTLFRLKFSARCDCIILCFFLSFRMLTWLWLCQAVILQPLGNKGIAIVGGDMIRGFTTADQVLPYWIYNLYLWFFLALALQSILVILAEESWLLWLLHLWLPVLGITK